ncbi:MAG: hypothetical protein GX997_09455 [Bacteroidales bacterium]|nr:hypothetical protein [Bacteroidales bacterium]
MIEDIGQSLMLSLKESNFGETLASGADIVVGQLIDGPLKDIPVFGTLLKIANTGIDVKNLLFAKKVESFLYQLNDIPRDQRIKFVELLKKKGMYAKVGVNVVLLIERVDDMDKTAIIGRLFSRWIEGKIDQDTFFRLSHIVVRAYLPDLKSLAENHDNPILNQWLSDFQTESLYNLGLLSANLVSTTRVSLQHGLSEEGIPSLKYGVNALARTLIAMGFD